MRVAYLGNFLPTFSTESHMAASFELNGHEVTRIQEGETRAVDVAKIAEGHDLFVWTQTYGLAVSGGSTEERAKMLLDLKDMGITTVGFHLDKWWDLPRADQLVTEPFFRCDHVFTADGGNQERFELLGINHHWLPPGVFEPECVRGRDLPEFRCDVAFVGSWQGHYHPEWRHRRELVTWLTKNYGGNAPYGPEGRLGLFPRGGREAVRGTALSDLYASAKVVVGDSCMVSAGGHYWSDRVPETLGRGGFLLHPFTPGLTDHFEPGRHLDCWEMGDWGSLRTMIDRYLDAPDARAQISGAGRQHVLANHTYTVRVQQILNIVELQRLGENPMEVTS